MPRKRRKSRLPGIRESNGRLSRKQEDRTERTEMSEREAKSVVLNARLRMTGLAENLVDGKPETGKPNVGTTQGLLFLHGYITLDQWTACEWYLHKRNEYLQAVKAPGAQWQPSNESTAGDPDAYIAWCRNIVATWEEIRTCLREASVASRSPIISAFEHILENQFERNDARKLVKTFEYMFGDLRLGLNAVNHTFLTARRRAA